MTKKVSKARDRAVPAFHPLAAIDPLMTGGAYASLIADIRAHGLREPVVLYKGKILDGRNRARACAEAGVPLASREMDFVDDAAAAAFVDSINWYRRHLTPEQKRDRIAARLKANPNLSDRQVAKQTDTSHTRVSKVRHELEQAGDVATVATSTDTKGRKQPRAKRSTAKPAATTASPAATTEPARHSEPSGFDEETRVAASEPETKAAPAPHGGAGPYSAGEHDRLLRAH